MSHPTPPSVQYTSTLCHNCPRQGPRGPTVSLSHTSPGLPCQNTLDAPRGSGSRSRVPPLTTPTLTVLLPSPVRVSRRPFESTRTWGGSPGRAGFVDFCGPSVLHDARIRVRVFLFRTHLVERTEDQIGTGSHETDPDRLLWTGTAPQPGYLCHPPLEPRLPPTSPRQTRSRPRSSWSVFIRFQSDRPSTPTSLPRCHSPGVGRSGPGHVGDRVGSRGKYRRWREGRRGPHLGGSSQPGKDRTSRRSGRKRWSDRHTGPARRRGRDLGDPSLCDLNVLD